MPAQFHGGALHALGGEPREVLADGNRAGEGNLAHDVGHDEVLRDIRRHAEHEVQDARRQAGIGEALHQFVTAGRGFFRSLDDDRAAGGERAGDLAHRRQRREIPRRESGDDADRLLQHDLAHALAAARHDATVSAAAFLCVPVDDVGRGHHLDARFVDRLALLHGLRGGYMFNALAQQIGGLAHDLAALIGRCAFPDLKALLGGAERAIEIGLAGVRQLRQHLAGRRIDDVLALAAFAVKPLAVDIKLQIGIHGGPRGYPGQR